MDKLASMLLFAQVVEAHSFSAAARRAGIAKSAVSKRIAQLEADLKVRLINRSTRQLKLTEVGQAYYEHCARIAREAEDAAHTVANLAVAPRGLLRVSASSTFTMLHMAPLLAGFLRRYPEVRLEVEATDRVVDLLAEDFDLALRISMGPAENLVARKLVALRWSLCAAPDYLARRGQPATPADLARHDCLTHSSSLALSSWRFRRGDAVETVSVAGSCSVNNAETLRHMARAGAGVVLLPNYVVGEDIQSGRLIALLTEHVAFEESALYAVYKPARHMAPKQRVFIDYLVEVFAAPPPWERAQTAPAL
ncbi:MAG: LysR family transcriptional regulator [Rhodocyclaceae bacterium]|nr:LysR family transcriptional regulator [Rhodocyclaceae bacterium]